MSGARFVGVAALLLLAGCSLEPQPPQVSGQVRASIDFHAVRLYVPQCAPSQYKTVAKLDASKLGNFSSYQFNMRWIEKLRKQAAGMGANGLLLIPINRAKTMGAVRHGPAFKASAIWEPSEQAPAAGTLSWAEPCTQSAKLLRYQILHGWGPTTQEGSG